MLATYKFNAASGHTIEATRTVTGYDVYTMNAEGRTISTVALSALAAEILFAELEAARPAPAPKRAAAKRKAVR
jgi:hypothetical protein